MTALGHLAPLDTLIPLLDLNTSAGQTYPHSFTETYTRASKLDTHIVHRNSAAHHPDTYQIGDHMLLQRD